MVITTRSESLSVTSRQSWHFARAGHDSDIERLDRRAHRLVGASLSFWLRLE
jgi:hypothetical protein